MGNSEAAARALGWFSLALGAVQLAAPRAFARAVGFRGGAASVLLTRAAGVREVGAGVGLLTQARLAPWQWARVGGDLMDLALLGAGLTSEEHRRGRLAAALGAVGGITAADILTAGNLDRGAVEFSKAITINRSREDVYRFWRDFDHFPTFMSHLEAVAVIDDRMSHWTARGPAGRTIEWDAEIVHDRPDELISWRSVASSQVQNSGTVRFVAAPGGRGTEVRVQIDYVPPAGTLGVTLARLFGQEPRQQIQADLRKVKQVLETGEVIRSDATLGGTQFMQRPAQPPGELEPSAIR
jgi:uncharacterized membrane protein